MSTIPEVLAARGNRLTVHRLMLTLGDTGELEMLVVGQTDEVVKRAERVFPFDAEQLDEALAELDRLHAELTQE